MTARHWILLAFIALCVPYAFATPIFEKNDESEHFAVAWHIAQGKGLPVQQPSAETPWMQEGSQPPLYYWLASLPIRLFDTNDFEAQLVLNATPQYAPFAPNNKNRFLVTESKRPFHYTRTTLAAVVLRLLNIIPGCVTVWFAYAVAHALSKNNRAALLGMALTAFNPMFLTVTTAVSNDALVIAFATAALALLLRNLGEGWNMRKAVGLGLLLGCASLSKLSGTVLLPVALLSVLLASQPDHTPGFLKKPGLGVRAQQISCAVALCLCWAAVAGWWFARNVALYGEPTGISMMAQIATPRSISLLTALGEFQGFRWSYLGIFGQFSVAANGIVYRLWDVFLVLCGVGLLVRLIKNRRSGLSPSQVLVMLFICVTLASILRWTLMTTASQGRLLFPCIAGVSAFMAIGVGEIRDRVLSLSKGWRLEIRDWQIYLQSLISNLLLSGFAVLIPFLTIAPAYAPPLVQQLPAGAIAVQQRLEPYAEIIGYSMTPSHVKPGDVVRVQVFTRALRPTQFSYLLVAKLYGQQARQLARFNTYSGNGLWPSNFWQPGDLMRDDIEFTVPLTAPAPSLLRAQFELYNPGSGDIVQSTDAQGKDGAPLYEGATLLPGSAINPSPALASFGDFAQLISYSVVSDTTGHFIKLNWQPQRAADKDYTVFVHVVNADGSPAFQSDGPPAQGEFPTTRWLQSAAFADLHPITLPPHFKPGPYRLQVGLYDPVSGVRVEARAMDGSKLRDDAFEAKIEIE